MVPFAAHLGLERGRDGAAIGVAEHDEKRRWQMELRVLQAPRDFRRAFESFIGGNGKASDG